jgi:phosphoribosyl 1,2-cyclic phosphodiesterase
MSELIVYTLFSGSKGNCTYIKSGDTEVLIDLGVSLRSISKSLSAIGTSMNNISDIFITHDHSDHTRGLESACSKHNLRVHITEGSAKAVIKEDLTPCLSEKAVIHPLLYTETVGSVTVSSFQTPHDSKASVGFVVKASGHTLGFATDIGHISDSVKKNLTGADLVILEANHDIELLNEGSYPQFLKERILSNYGHLSNDSAAEFAAYLAENGTKSFILAHLSEENNIPEMAFAAVYSALGNIRSRGISLKVAEPYLPTRLVITEE